MNRPLPSTGTSAPTSSCRHTVGTSGVGTHSPRLNGCRGKLVALQPRQCSPHAQPGDAEPQTPAWAVWTPTLGCHNLLPSL